MIRVAHLIHTTGIGGVETAADQLVRRTRNVDYRVLALRQDSPAAVCADCAGTGVNSLRSVRIVLACLDRLSPDVLVTSLWRSVLIGALHRLRNPHTRWVVYVHNSRYTNLADTLAHRLAFRFADCILGDSMAALEALVPAARSGRAEVVCPDSALLALARGAGRTRAVPAGDDRVRLVYWGRAAAQKRLDRAVELVGSLEGLAPGRFALDIIAPHSSVLGAVLEHAVDRGLAVRWLGPGSAEEILSRSAGACFFLQLSEFEGLGMAVREAMALGIVPVVTPVGAIRRYTADGVDAIHVEQTADGEITPGHYATAASRIVSLIANEPALSAMSRSARTVPDTDFVTDFERAVLRAAGSGVVGEER